MKNLEQVMSEITACISSVSQEKLNEAAKFIAEYQHKKIICVAAGRMGYSLRAFAMRLMHLGFDNVSFIGDTNVPYADKDTLVIFGSSSGETKTNVLYANILKGNCKAEFKHDDETAKILTITCEPESTLAKLSDLYLIINAINSFQPMKTVYEQSTYVLYDILALELMDVLGLKNSDMRNNHSILE